MAIGNYRLHAEEIVSDYKLGKGFMFILKKYHVDYESVKKLLEENGIATKPNHGIRHYPINEDFFEKIDSHEKAYFLGYLWADGNNRIGRGGRGNSVRIQLSDMDEDILVYFRDLIFTENAPKMRESFRDKYRYLTLVISSKKISEDLLKLGMNGQKSKYSKIPSIPDLYMGSFILGYFDGDGSIYYRKTLQGAQINITSEICIITDIKNTIYRLTGVNMPINQCANKISYMVVTGDYCKIRAFYRFAYAFQKTFLKRKHDKFLDYFKRNEELERLCDNISPPI